MRQLTCPATGVLAVVHTPQPSIGAGEILVRLTYCGICGTDLTKVHAADVPKPVQLGHEVVGVVAAIGAGVDDLHVGQRIACAHHVPDFASHYTRSGSGPMDPAFKRSNLDPGGFAEYIRLPAAHVRHALQAVPDDVPDLRAVFMEPLACCLRGLDRVATREGDVAVIVGVGAVGLLFVPLLADRSVTTVAVDVRDERLALAQEWGAALGLLPGRDDVAGAVHAMTAARGADLVVLTVLNAATLALALAALRDGGAILVFGAKPATILTVDVWNIWRREINVISSYSATPDLLPRAMAILRRPEYRLEMTVSHVLPLAAGAEAFRIAHAGLASKVVVGK